VRHLIGLDPQRRGIAIADLAEPGQQLAFCRRDVEAARRDHDRASAPRSAARSSPRSCRWGPRRRRPAEGRRIVGALYVSCHRPRRPALIGAPSAELQLVRHALGDVPG
jgi:small ligand-binding sensory domain FIST